MSKLITENDLKAIFDEVFPPNPPSAKIGQIIAYAGSDEPNGWLKCDGRAVSRTTYSLLFSVIGTSFGTGDGSTTFNLPDLRDRFPVGAGTTYSLNSKGGSKDAIIPYHNHDVAAVNIASSGGHSHTVPRHNNSGSGSAYTYATTSSAVKFTQIAVVGNGAHTHSVPAHSTGYKGTDGNTTNANLPPYIGVNYLIYAGGDIAPIATNPPMEDWIIGTGTDNNWHYKKYSSGEFDAWISFESNVACDTASGSLYKSADQTLNLPSFILTNALDSWVINGSINGFESIWFLTFDTVDRYVKYNLVRTSSRTAASRNIKMTLQGRWK